MPAPFFSTNPADWTQLEGLYISEQNPPGFIRGVSLSTVGVYGTTLKGPPDTAIEITSESRFLEIFGSDRHAAGGGAIASEVWKALLNKPFGKTVVVRVVASGGSPLAATVNLQDTMVNVLQVDASSIGVWGNDLTVSVEDATDGDANHFNLRVTYKGVDTLYENLNITTGNDNTATVVPSIDDEPAVNIALTKLADGRPDNVADTALTTGADGTIASADYTGAGKGLDILANYKGVSVVFCANEDGAITAAVNAQTLVEAAASSDRMFVIHEGELTGASVVPATVATDAGSFRSDRIIYAHNAPWTLDPEVGTIVQTAPNSWMASILSQTFVDIHPGEEATKAQTAGISKLDNESLSRADYITLRDAGVASLERDAEGGFVFVSGVTTNLTTGLTEITRRRMADFLQLSVADRLKFFVKKKNTKQNRGVMGGEVSAFLRDLQDDGRIVEAFEVDQESQNTDATRAQGLEFILMRVRLLGHILHLVLQTEIGTGVTIEV